MYRIKDDFDKEGDREPDRINMRTTVGIKRMLQEAANLSNHGDLSAFILGIAEERAENVLRLYEESTLLNEDRERFYAFLENPPKPSEALVALFARQPSENFRVVS
jgi:uncharacterized protein (DUF1778 family)